MSVSIIASISGIWMYFTLALLSTRGKDRDRVCREIEEERMRIGRTEKMTVKGDGPEHAVSVSV